jgi:hypothetical protein
MVAKKRRAPGTACQFGRRCLAAYVIDGRRLCARHAADEVFAQQVRASLGGACWAFGEGRVLCNGAIQCAHIMSRRYHAIRWDKTNAVPLCMAHHVFYTYKPLEWEQLVRDAGVDYDHLRWRALNERPVNPVDFLETAGAVPMQAAIGGE